MELISYLRVVWDGWAFWAGLLLLGIDVGQRFMSEERAQRLHLRGKPWLAVAIALLFLAQFMVYRDLKRSAAIELAAVKEREGEVNRRADRLSEANDALAKQMGDVAVQCVTRDSQAFSSQTLLSACQVQVSDQQKIIGELGVRVDELEKLPELEISYLRAPNVTITNPERSHWFFALTNQTISPVRSIVACQGALEAANAWLGGGGFMSAPMRLAPNAFQFFIDTPAWTPENALVVVLKYEKDPSPCQIVAKPP